MRELDKTFTKGSKSDRVFDATKELSITRAMYDYYRMSTCHSVLHGLDVVSS